MNKASKSSLRVYWPTVAGIALGVSAGYLLWKFPGCCTGSCPLTSSALMSSIYGGVIGGLLGSIFTVLNIRKYNKRNK